MTQARPGVLYRSIGDSDLSPVLGTGTVSGGPMVNSCRRHRNGYHHRPMPNRRLDDAGDVSLDLSGLTGLASPAAARQVIMDNQNLPKPGIMTSYSIGRTTESSRRLFQPAGARCSAVAAATFTS